MSEEKQVELEMEIDNQEGLGCFFWLCICIISGWTSFLVCLVMHFILK